MSASNHAPVDIFASSSEHDDSGSGSDAEHDHGSVSDGSNTSVSSSRSFFLAATGTRLDRDVGDELLADVLRAGVVVDKDLFTVVYGAVRRLTDIGLRYGAIARRRFGRLRLSLRLRSAAFLDSAGGEERTNAKRVLKRQHGLGHGLEDSLTRVSGKRQVRPVFSALWRSLKDTVFINTPEESSHLTGFLTRREAQAL